MTKTLRALNLKRVVAAVCVVFEDVSRRSQNAGLISHAVIDIALRRRRAGHWIGLKDGRVGRDKSGMRLPLLPTYATSTMVVGVICL